MSRNGAGSRPNVTLDGGLAHRPCRVLLAQPAPRPTTEVAVLGLVGRGATPVVGDLLPRPRRAVYLGSDMRPGASADLGHLDRLRYGQSKFLLTVLAAAVARVRPDVVSQTVDLGWVPTRCARPRPDPYGPTRMG